MGRHLVVNSYIAILFITIFGSIAAMTIVKVAFNNQTVFAQAYQDSAQHSSAAQTR